MGRAILCPQVGSTPGAYKTKIIFFLEENDLVENSALDKLSYSYWIEARVMVGVSNLSTVSALE